MPANLLELVNEFALPVHQDDRGYLLKAVKKEFTGESAFGEIYFVSSAPGIVRANHFHRIASEWFVVVQGTADLTLIDPAFPLIRKLIRMDSKQPVCVLVPSGVAHSIRATGTETMLLMAFANKGYDPMDTDTFAYDFS